MFDKDYDGDTLTNKYDEEVRVYNPSGELNCQYKIINNMLNGNFTAYYKNGNKKSEINYTDNKRNGIEKIYYESGQLEGITTYKNNLINGLDLAYYQNHKLQHYALWKDSSTIYWLEFDSTGKILSEESRGNVKFPDTIHSGEKFQAEFSFPLLKGLTRLNQFNAAVIPENIYTIDSMKGYLLYSLKKNNKWVYQLKNNEKGIRIDNYEKPLYIIPINEQGYGVYEFTPSMLGHYSIMGDLVTSNIEKGIKDTALTEEHVYMDFTVIK